MRIPLLARIHPNSEFKERCSFLRCTTHFFDTQEKQDTYVIKSRKAKGYEVSIYKLGNNFASRKRSRLWGAFKGTLYVTIVIPIIVYVGLLIYRALNRFHLGPSPLNQAQMPNELLHIVARYSGKAALQLASTSKVNRERIQQDPWFKRGSDLLKRSREVANSQDQENKDLTYKWVRANLSPSLKKEWIEIHPDHHRVRLIAESNLEEALEIVRAMESSSHQAQALARIAKDIADSKENDGERHQALDQFNHAIASFQLSAKVRNVLEEAFYVEKCDFAYLIALSNVDEALRIKDRLDTTWERSKVQRAVIDALIAKGSFEKAFEIAHTMEATYSKSEAFVLIFKYISARAMERAVELIRNDTRFNIIYVWSSAIAGIAASDLDKALEIVSGETDAPLIAEALKIIARTIRYSDIERALLIANTIQDQWSKDCALSHVAEALVIRDPTRALLVIDMIEDKRIKAEALVKCAFRKGI